MCTLAVVAAAVGWWTRYASTHLAADFWGPESSALLIGSSQVELLKLDNAEFEMDGIVSPEANTQIFGQRIVSRHNISDAKGLSHLRSALVEDRNFDWSQQATSKPKGSNPWAWGLRFHLESASTTVLLSSDFFILGKLHASGKTVNIIPCPEMAQPLSTYFQSIENEFSLGQN